MVEAKMTQSEALPGIEFDKLRETRFEYVESFRGAHKTIRFTTYLTAAELLGLVGKLMDKGENFTAWIGGEE